MDGALGLSGSFLLSPSPFVPIQAISWLQQQKFADLMWFCPLLLSASHHTSLLRSDGTGFFQCLCYLPMALAKKKNSWKCKARGVCR